MAEAEAQSGAATQSLRGGAGADLTFGTDDDAPDPHLVHFRLLGQVSGVAALDGPAAAAAVWQDGAARLYAAGAETGSGGVAGWSLTGGALAPVYSQLAQYYDLDAMLTGAPALAAVRHDGADYLLTGGVGVSLARLDPGGAPEPLESAHADWDNGLLYPGAFAAYEADGALHVLVGGGWEGGLSVLRWDAFGLRAVARVEDGPGGLLADIADLEVVEIGARRFAVAASRGDGALTVHELGAGAPVLRARRWVGDDETGFDLAGIAAVEVAEIGGAVYVYASAEGGRLVTYRLGGDGALTRLASRAGAEGLAHVAVDGRDWLLAISGGAAIAAYAIEAGGRLDPLGTFALDAGARASAISATVSGGLALVSVARADVAGADLFEFALEALAPPPAPPPPEPTEPPPPDPLAPTPGADDLRGGGGRDRLRGENGDDVLYGRDGDDWLHGGRGDDRVKGGDGRDVLVGGDGGDWLHGGTGDDRLEGGKGHDRLIGGNGDDALSGGPGRDVLYGGRGADTLRGGPHADRLFGGGGDDRLEGGHGHDLMRGGGRADRLWGGEGHDDIAGGSGRDRLWGGGGRDALEGGGNADELHGGRGHDVLRGGHGPDLLDGGPGHDRLIGGHGHDRLTGGPGHDRFEFDRRDGRDVIEDFGDGRDRLVFRGADGMDDLLIRDRGDAVIHFGGTVVRLPGVDADDLGPGDFLFG